MRCHAGTRLWKEKTRQGWSMHSSLTGFGVSEQIRKSGKIDEPQELRRKHIAPIRIRELVLPECRRPKVRCYLYVRILEDKAGP